MTVDCGLKKYIGKVSRYAMKPVEICQGIPKNFRGPDL